MSSEGEQESLVIDNILRQPSSTNRTTTNPHQECDIIIIVEEEREQQEDQIGHEATKESVTISPSNVEDCEAKDDHGNGTSNLTAAPPKAIEYIINYKDGKIADELVESSTTT